MRVSWLKIFLFLLSICLLAGSVYAAWWYYQKVYRAENVAMKERGSSAKGLPPPDPGLAIYSNAVDMLNRGEEGAGRDQLLEIMRHYQDSKRFPDAKRIIGEININSVLSDDPGPGKEEYIVKRGDSINAIVAKTRSTLEYIVRVNGLYSLMLRPGDRLITAELQFEAVADISAQTITLLRNGRFFKEYAVTAVKLPPNVRVPFETSLRSRSALDKEGNSIAPLKKDYASSEKWLICARAGVLFRTHTHPMKDTDTGLFLTAEDMDELVLLLPLGTPVKFVN